VMRLLPLTIALLSKATCASRYFDFTNEFYIAIYKACAVGWCPLPYAISFTKIICALYDAYNLRCIKRKIPFAKRLI
jgi:hypothetical protein